MVDHQGNTVNSHLNHNQHEFAHTVAVNQVDIDSRGEYVATCSDDGKVNVIGLFSNDDNQTINCGRAIRAAVLDPDPKVSEGKRFIVGKLKFYPICIGGLKRPLFYFAGDEKLTLYEKNFLKKLKPNVLSNAEGHVISICWNGPFVAWASCLGVRVYDLNEKCSLGLMKWEEPTK